MDIDWRGSGAPIRIRPAAPASPARRIIPINVGVSHAEHVSILNEPLTPANKLAQAERWLKNIQYNLKRRSASRDENVRACLRDFPAVAEALDAAGCGALGLDRDLLTAQRVGEACGYRRCMTEHAEEALHRWERGRTEAAEDAIRCAIADADKATATLRRALVGRAG